MSHICNDRDGVCEEDHCRCDDVDINPMKTLSQVLKDFMESEPVKRVLAIEDTAIVTGRTGQYHGSTIQDEFRKSLQKLLEEVVPEKQEGYTLEGDRYEVCRQEIKERIRKIINN